MLRHTSLFQRARHWLDSPFAFLTSIVLLGLLLRLVVVFFVVHDSGHTINDSNFGYESWEMGWVARSLFHHQGFSSPFLPVTGPTALVPPLYPFLIAIAFRTFGLYTQASGYAVLGFNSLCSALTCIPLYYLVLNSLKRRVARVAALAWAVYPFAVYFAADRVWDYALTGLLFTCCLLVAQKLPMRGPLGWLGFGVLYGVAVLSNPSIATLLPFFLLMAVYKSRGARTSWFPKLALALAGFVLVCTPWQIRNHRVMHADFFIRDGFWLEFYAGNNGDTTESNSSFAHPASNPVEMSKYQGAGEIGYMAEKRDRSIAFVQDHPGFFALATARRFVRFWTGYWSFRPEYLKYEPFDLPNVPFCLALMFFMLRGLRRWTKYDRDATVPYILALLVFPVPYYLTHASMDYRQPIEPIIIVLVSIGLFGTGEPALEERKTAFELEADMQEEREAVLV